MSLTPIFNTAYDAHVHLQIYPQTLLPTVLKRARQAGVYRFGCCGTQPDDWEDVLMIATTEAGVEPACGLHPWYSTAPDLPTNWLERLDQLLNQHPALEIGEIGLDALRPKHEAQMQAFTAQLDLAVKYNRGITLHAVRAHSEMLEALRPRAKYLPHMLLHGVSCSLEIWREYEKLGACVSIGPAVLNPRAKKVRALAYHVPADRLFFETDSPDRAVNGCAIDALGGRNAPENLPKIVASVHALRSPCH